MEEVDITQDKILEETIRATTTTHTNKIQAIVGLKVNKSFLCNSTLIEG